MESFHDAVLRLDADNAHVELVSLLRSKPPNIHETINVIFVLLGKVRLQSSFVLAKMLADAQYRHISVSVALCFGGLLYNQREEMKRGMASLADQAGKMTKEQKRYYLKSIILPVMPNMISSGMIGGRNEVMLRLVDILSLMDPHFCKLLDLDAPVPELSLAELQRHGREQTRLITYPLPPPDVPRQKRRVLVAARETVFMREGSRLCDIGPRITLSMKNYGWEAEFIGFKDSVKWWIILPEICRQKKIDVLVLEDGVITGSKGLNTIRASMIARLRQENPSLKIVGYQLDSWLKQDILQETSAIIDLVWDFSAPSLPIWQDPAIVNKVLFFPGPFADFCGTPEQPLQSDIVFAGSVKGWNWHRALWLDAADRMQLPVKRNLSTHTEDGLSALESYKLYMRRLTDSTCCLNFTMRPDIDHTCIVTARSFEVIFSGSLLVQESTPDMHSFFVSGEHYLEFSSVAELAAIVRFISDHKDEAEEIRRRGNAFALERYSSDNLIGYLDKALFFPD